MVSRSKIKKTFFYCQVCGKKTKSIMYVNRVPVCAKHYGQCLHCGEPFIKRYTCGFCDESKCQREYRKSLIQKGKETFRGRELKSNCKHCGKLFVRTESGQKYCTPACYRDFAVKNLYERGRFLIFERDSFRCFYCGRSSFGDGMELHADHVHPKSDGGEDIAGNLVTACARCNVEKLDYPLRNEEEILAEVEKRNEQAGIYPETKIKL